VTSDLLVATPCSSSAPVVLHEGCQRRWLVVCNNTLQTHPHTPPISHPAPCIRLALNPCNNMMAAGDGALQLSALRSLDVSFNQLESLPLKIGSMQTLRTLHLEGNHLSDLPPEMATLTMLQVLLLGKWMGHPFVTRGAWSCPTPVPSARGSRGSASAA
jgi:hypothetical protein